MSTETPATDPSLGAPTALTFTLSDAEHTQAYAFARRQLIEQVRGSAKHWRLSSLSALSAFTRVFIWALLVGLIWGALRWLHLSRTELIAGVLGIGLIAGIVNLVVQLKRQQQRLQELWRERLGDQLSVGFSPVGLRISSVLGETLFEWRAVQQAQIANSFVFIRFLGLTFVPIPLRIFSSEAEATAFVDQINAHAQGGASTAAPTLYTHAPPPSQPHPSFITALTRNLRAALHLTVLRSHGAAQLHPNVGQFFALVLLGTLVGFVADFAHVGPNGVFEWMGLRAVLVVLLICVATAWLATIWVQADTSTDTQTSMQTLLRVAVGLAALCVVFEVIGRFREAETLSSWIGGWVASTFSKRPAAWITWSLPWVIWLWFVLAVGLLAARVVEASTLRKVGAGITAALATTLATWSIGRSDPLWSKAYDAAAAERSATQWQSAATEAVVYRQPQLLQQALEAVEPGRPGTPELYYIGLAGAGYQDVFVNEVESVEKLLQQQFNARGHGVLLVNAARTPLERPFASVTALEKTLNTLAQRMNVDEDVLFLFMTSHGSRKHEFQIDLWPYRFDTLTPERLRALLDASGIRHRVIVVSACYSGGFIPALSTPDTLVITASRADRTSFGCEDGKAWTYFGEAYFAQALTQTHSFEQAFHLATERIGQREHSEKRDASEPQMQVGARISETLQPIEHMAAQTPAP